MGSSVAADEIPKAEKNELFCAYATMILEDSGIQKSAANINKLIEAANGSADGYYVELFAKLLNGKDIASLLKFGGGGGPAAPVAAAAPVSGGDAPAKEEAKVVEEEEEEEEEMDFDLFG